MDGGRRDGAAAAASMRPPLNAGENPGIEADVYFGTTRLQ